MSAASDAEREVFFMRAQNPFWIFVPLLAVLYSLLACSRTPPWAGSVSVQDGVEIIFNPADPLLPEPEAPVSELWNVQGSHWVDPARVHSQSGFITVVDPPANQIHAVLASGEIRGSVGRPGGGPGEFLRLLDAFSDGSRLIVLDGGKGSVEYLDLDGTYRSSVHLDGQPWGGFPLEGGVLLVKGEFLSDPAAETLGDWVRIEEGRDPTAFTSRSLDPLPEEEGVQCSDLFSWGQGAARLRSTTPQLQLFDQAGGLLMETRIDLPVEAIPDSERESALSELARGLAGRGLPPQFIEQNLVVQEERWRVKCRFGPLRFDASRRFGAFLEQNPDEFHFVSQEGVYLARVRFPTPWRDFTMDAGIVYALTRDPETDLTTLRAFRVDIPSSLLAEATRVLDEASRAEIREG